MDTLGRTAGGVVPEGQMYILGNDLPELFVPNTSSTVLNPQQTESDPDEVSLYVLIAFLAVLTDFDIQGFKQKVMETCDWLDRSENRTKLGKFLTLMEEYESGS